MPAPSYEFSGRVALYSEPAISCQGLAALAQRVVASGVSNMAHGVASPVVAWASMPLRWVACHAYALTV